MEYKWTEEFIDPETGLPKGLQEAIYVPRLGETPAYYIDGTCLKDLQQQKRDEIKVKKEQ